MKIDLEDVDGAEINIRAVSGDKITFSVTEVALYDILDQIDPEDIREYLGE